MEIEGVPKLFVIILISLMLSTVITTNGVFIDAISGEEIESIACVLGEDQSTIHCYEYEGEEEDKEFLFSILPFPGEELKFHFALADDEGLTVDLSEYFDIKDFKNILNCEKNYCTMELKDKSEIDFLRLGRVLYLKWDNIKDIIFSVHY